MKTLKREIRTCGLNVAIREAEGQEPGESRTIVGTAIVFNAESEVLDDFGVAFKEVIKPEAAQMAFLNTQDIKLNLLHDRHDTIARCKEGVGNMTISVDQNGVNFEAEMPRCDLGDRALEMVRAGVYTGCSFEFIPDKYEVEERGDQVLITHERFQKVLAFTLAMDPAYQQTSVNARELVTDHSEEEKKAEAEKERELKERELKREREKSAAMRRMRDREAEAQDF